MTTIAKNQQVRQIKQRNASLAWWASVIRAHPLGVVPVPTAARILGVSPQRVRILIDQERLTLIDGMPGGNERDKFIPLEDLLDAPFAMTRGKPGVYGPKNRYTKNYLENYRGHRISSEPR